MNGSLAAPQLDVHPAVRHYRGLNRLLDQQVVPYTVNEARIVAFRERVFRLETPSSACYWLLMARLAELALLCAGHYAGCGEIGAAGDLLVNPRRIEIHVRGADRPFIKDRHRRLSEQFNPRGLSLPEFTDWFRRHAFSRIVEPALLPDFLVRLQGSGWLSEAFLSALQDRMTQVADAMRFASIGRIADPPDGGQAFGPGCSAGGGFRAAQRYRFNDATYRRLGRHVERTCSDPAYRSTFLAEPLIRCGTTAAAAGELFSALPAQAAV